MLIEAVAEWCGLVTYCRREVLWAAVGTVVGGSFLLAVLAVLAGLWLAIRAALRRR